MGHMMKSAYKTIELHLKGHKYVPGLCMTLLSVLMQEEFVKTLSIKQ